MAEELYDDFGDPEGQRDVARTEDVLSALFVETVSTSAFLDSTPDHHVVFGPKGSGKSLLLFRKAVQVRQKDGVIVAPTKAHAYVPTNVFGGAEKWTPYWPLERAEGGARRADWAGLWAWALATAVLLRWREHAETEPDLQSFMRDVEAPLDGIVEDNPYHLVSSELFEMANRSRRSRGQPILPRSENLTRLLGRYANSFPPTYLFLDNQDETYEENPEYWRNSGYGCFLAIRELHAATAHRLHVFMTLRAEVVEDLRSSEHFSKWTRDLFEIGWSDADLLRVFESRAVRLKPRHLRGAGLGDVPPLLALLGPEFAGDSTKQAVMRMPRAETARRRVVLSFDQYLLRHTLRRPRDLVVLGNKIIEARRMGVNQVHDEMQLVRESIGRASSEILAEGYLAEVNGRWPWATRPGGGIKEFFSRHIRRNIISLREVDAIEVEYSRRLGSPRETTRPFAELARLGVIGWPVQNPHRQRGDLQHFIRPGDTQRAEIPASARFCLVHPVFYGPPFHVAVVPGVLIGPGLPFSYRPVRKWDTCVITYGQCDENIAVQLYDKLVHEGVECWLRMCGADPTEDSFSKIYRQMDLGERAVYLCSAEALRLRGFTDDVVSQEKRDGRKLVSISLDSQWVGNSHGVLEASAQAREALMGSNPIPLWRLGLDDTVNQLLSVITKQREKRKIGLGQQVTGKRRRVPDPPAPASPDTTRTASSGLRPRTILAPGAEVVTGYRLVARIGQGGFGEVWKAVGPGGVPVALKLLSAIDGSARYEAQSLEFMKFVKHPHLLAIFAVWDREDRLVIGMELADGTLFQRLERAIEDGWSGIPFPELIEYMGEAAKAIDFLNQPRHAVGAGASRSIIHRDIKPQNLLLVGSGLKVGDYGLAEALERSGAMVSGGITPAYAAPELIRGTARRQSDQYSLAVSYYQLRTGALPFAGTRDQVIEGHLTADPDLSFLPKPERRVVARAMAKHPGDRWPSCQRFVRELSASGKKWSLMG